MRIDVMPLAIDEFYMAIDGRGRRGVRPPESSCPAVPACGNYKIYAQRDPYLPFLPSASLRLKEGGAQRSSAGRQVVQCRGRRAGRCSVAGVLPNIVVQGGAPAQWQGVSWQRGADGVGQP